MTLASRLPAFTWDRIAPLREKAGLHPDGAVDLSIGTPVDPVPGLIRDALAAASDAPGYPATWGTPRLRSAAAGWLARAHGVPVSPDDVLPVVGTKEFIAWLPVMLGLGPGDVVLQPELAYPTYDIGARLAGASVLAADSLLAAGPVPGPAGLGELAVQPDRPGAAGRAPAQGGGLGQGTRRGGGVRRVLHLAGLGCRAGLGAAPFVCDGSHEGVLAVHSLSKRSNLAGYRAGFVTGDPALVADLLAIRKQAGMIMPGPVQAAMAAALSDEAHAAEQRERYAARRSVLLAAFAEAGWAIDHSEAGLYLWATHPAHDCWSAAELLATEGGILVAPGELYGPAGKTARPGGAHRHRRARRGRGRAAARTPLRVDGLAGNGVRTYPGAAKFERCSAGALPKQSTRPLFVTAVRVPGRPVLAGRHVLAGSGTFWRAWHVLAGRRVPGGRRPSRGDRPRPGSM